MHIIFPINMAINRINKDRSSRGTSFSKFWPIWKSYRQKNQQQLGKKTTGNFAIYLLLFTAEILPFVRKKASQNSMRKKVVEVGNTIGYIEKFQRSSVKH